MSLILGDCRQVLAGMDSNSVDAIVTDPPYGIGFMGREWDAFGGPLGIDHNRTTQRSGSMQAGKSYNRSLPGNRSFQIWCEEWAAECLRVLKPGGYLVAFGGPRTFHRLTCGIEDAGFEIRDCLMWLFGSGFPKSLDVSKALDKAAGAERAVVGRRTDRAATPKQDIRGGRLIGGANGAYDGSAITAPATDLARQWDGWGTALKPAWEPIILARKPLIGTVAANVTAHSTGAINVDGCRIDLTGEQPPTGSGDRRNGLIYAQDEYTRTKMANGGNQTPASGRWPANVILDDAAAAALDEVAGTLRARGNIGPSKGGGGLYGHGQTLNAFGAGDAGGPSRFFYTAKSSRFERNAGLDGLPESRVHPPSGDDRVWDIPGSRSTPRANHHPTVKPISLMRWLCRLVTPPGGLVVDIFADSGTTGCAAVLEGFQFVGVEREPEYLEIARRRIDYWQRQGRQLELDEGAA